MNNARFDISGMLWSLALAITALTSSFLVAIKLMGDIYYAEWLVASCLALFLLIAWLLYLRDDRLMKKGDTDPEEKQKPHAAPSTKGTRRVLLQTAFILGLATIVMYFCFGVGTVLKL